MKMIDLFEDKPSRYKTEDDVLSVFHKQDTRKVSLSLKDINKLKHLRRIRAEEIKNKLDFVSDMYGPQQEETPQI